MQDNIFPITTAEAKPIKTEFVFFILLVITSRKRKMLQSIFFFVGDTSISQLS